MRICMTTCCWQHAELTRAAYKSWRAAEAESEHELVITAVLSQDDPEAIEHVNAANELGVRWIWGPNSPLSNKFNQSVKIAEGFEWDYLMLMGSDDIVSPNFFSAYEHAIEGELKLWGWEDCYFYNEGQLYHWLGYRGRGNRRESIGAARFLRRDMLDLMEWQLWDWGLPRGLDGNMTMRLKRKGQESAYTPLPEGVYFVDVKTGVSVTKFEAYHPDDWVAVETPDWLREALP